MPLLDHFHPPLSERRHWHSFHNSWATYLSSQLNALLPPGYFAEANVQYGVEIDVATFDEDGASRGEAVWASPPAQVSYPFEPAGVVVEVGIFSRAGGPQLAGAVELVSPANKDRPAHREAFVSKCASYLHAGIGLVIVDVGAERPVDFHRDLLIRVVGVDPGPGPVLSGSAYRTVERDNAPVLDVWREAIELGQSLPTLPLWLRGGLCLPVELEATYQRTCIEQKVATTELAASV
ncbi:MAG: DUF4058 domain-containing protein [Gemmataceae bacterium]